MDQKKVGAELRLRKLAIDLKKAYSKVAHRVAETLAPIEIAVADIGETWKPVHYAESVRDQGPSGAVRSPTCFGHETFVNGDEADYALCVAQGPDRKTGVYVSICRYHAGASGSGNGGGNGEDPLAEKPAEVSIKSVLLAPVTSLPVPLRVKILDVLDAFASAYDEHVRDTRKEFLGQWGEETDSKSAASDVSDPLSEPLQPGADPLEAEPEPVGAGAKSSKGSVKFTYNPNGY
jgi:hypothetical protein